MTVVDLIGSWITKVDVTDLWMTGVDSNLKVSATYLVAWEMTVDLTVSRETRAISADSGVDVMDQTAFFLDLCLLVGVRGES